MMPRGYAAVAEPRRQWDHPKLRELVNAGVAAATAARGCEQSQPGFIIRARLPIKRQQL